MDGWIKSWRKLLDSRVFKNAELLKVWIWCLHKASHKQRWVSIKTGRGHTEVEIKPGQFIFGRFKASEELHMKPSSVRDRMRKLADLSNLTIQPDTHWSIVTICNWDRYQNDESDPRQATRHPTDTQPTPNRHPTDTDKKEENVKKEKKEEEGQKKEARAPEVTWTGESFTLTAEARKTFYDRFPNIQHQAIDAEIEDCAAYHADHGTKMASPRSRITTWLKKAFTGNHGGNGKPRGAEMTEIEVNRMYAKMLDEQPEPVETPEEMADRLEFKRNYPLRRDIG